MKQIAAVARQRVALVVLVSAQFVIMLDSSIINVALPSIQSDLGLTQTGTAWVANAYFLAFGGFLLVSGRAADTFGRIRMFLAGTATFTVASLLAGLAGSEAVLLLARLLQGCGAAILSPAALSLILVLFTGEGRTKAMSVWGAASAAGGATGVFAGGMIAATFGWQWVFFLPLPVCVAALLAAPGLFARSVKPVFRRRFDAAGAFTVTAGSVSSVYSVLAVADHGIASIHAIAGSLLALGFFVAFALIEGKAEDPVMPPGLLKNRRVSVGIVIGLVGGAARVSSFFLVGLWLQQALRYGPQAAGAAMLPTSVAVFALSLFLLPRVIRRIGPILTLTAGMTSMAAGLFWLANAPANASYAADVLPGLLLSAAGIALSFMPSTMIITSAVPAEHAGLASGMASASFQIGGALGIAVFSSTAALASAGSGLAGSAAAATAAGFQAAFIAAGCVSLLTAVLALILLSTAKTPQSGAAAQHPTVLSGSQR